MISEYVERNYGYKPFAVYELKNSYLCIFEEIGVIPIFVDRISRKIKPVDISARDNRKRIADIVRKEKPSE